MSNYPTNPTDRIRAHAHWANAAKKPNPATLPALVARAKAALPRKIELPPRGFTAKRPPMFTLPPRN